VAAMLAIAAASFTPPQAGGQAAEPASALAPIVVELFTSQGCSSCPPADVVLGELKSRKDVLPLSFHVTYGIGSAGRTPSASRRAPSGSGPIPTCSRTETCTHRRW
jgi:hypothetical protein